MSKFITFLDILITYPIFLLSLLIPRDKQLWVFVGWHARPEGEIFADNTKYLFLHTHHHAPAIKAVWLAKDKTLANTLRSHGYISYQQNSIMGTWYALRAGFTVIDAYLQRHNFRLSGRSKIIQLLHGKGMKQSGYAKKQYRIQAYIFGTSQFTLNLLPRSFTKNSKTFVTGYPRDDIFYKDVVGSMVSADIKTIEKIAELKKKGTRCILYAPTYRRGMTTFDITSILELEKFSLWLLKNNLVLFISLHPKYRAQTRAVDYESINFLEESDIQTLLSHFDLLISDYSSIFTDFLLLDKPMVFFPFDMQSYKEKEGISIDYEKMTPGEKIYSNNKLPEAILTALNQDTWGKVRKSVLESYHTYTDGNASQRIIDILSKKEKVKLR